MFVSAFCVQLFTLTLAFSEDDDRHLNHDGILTSRGQDRSNSPGENSKRSLSKSSPNRQHVTHVPAPRDLTSTVRSSEGRIQEGLSDDGDSPMSSARALDEDTWSYNFDHDETQCMNECRSSCVASGARLDTSAELSGDAQLAEAIAEAAAIAEGNVERKKDGQRVARDYTKYDVQQDTDPGFNNCNLVYAKFWNSPWNNMISIYIQFTSFAVPNNFYITICPQVAPSSQNVYYPFVPLDKYGAWPSSDMAQTSWPGFSFDSEQSAESRENCGFEPAESFAGSSFYMTASGTRPVLYLPYVKNYGYVGDITTGSYATVDAINISVEVGCNLDHAGA